MAAQRAGWQAVVDVRRSDQLTYLLRSIQRSGLDLSADPVMRRKPLDLVTDNDTRRLSQLYITVLL